MSGRLSSRLSGRLSMVPDPLFGGGAGAPAGQLEGGGGNFSKNEGGPVVRCPSPLCVLILQLLEFLASSGNIWGEVVNLVIYQVYYNVCC